MNDTSETIKLRWEVTRIHVMEAEVPVDQLPDSLIETDEDTWSVVTGDVDTYEGVEFLEALEATATTQSSEAESYVISDDVEHIPPVRVAAPPVEVQVSPEVAEYVDYVKGEVS